MWGVAAGLVLAFSVSLGLTALAQSGGGAGGGGDSGGGSGSCSSDYYACPGGSPAGKQNGNGWRYFSLSSNGPTGNLDGGFADKNMTWRKVRAACQDYTSGAHVYVWYGGRGVSSSWSLGYNYKGVDRYTAGRIYPGLYTGPLSSPENIKTYPSGAIHVSDQYAKNAWDKFISTPYGKPYASQLTWGNNVGWFCHGEKESGTWDLRQESRARVPAGTTVSGVYSQYENMPGTTVEVGKEVHFMHKVENVGSVATPGPISAAIQTWYTTNPNSWRDGDVGYGFPDIGYLKNPKAPLPPESGWSPVGNVLSSGQYGSKGTSDSVKYYWINYGGTVVRSGPPGPETMRVKAPGSQINKYICQRIANPTPTDSSQWRFSKPACVKIVAPTITGVPECVYPSEIGDKFFEIGQAQKFKVGVVPRAPVNSSMTMTASITGGRLGSPSSFGSVMPNPIQLTSNQLMSRDLNLPNLAEGEYKLIWVYKNTDNNTEKLCDVNFFVGRRPFFAVQGGDILAGIAGSAIKADVESWNVNGGAGTDFRGGNNNLAVIATGGIKNFVPGSDSNPGSRLGFANLATGSGLYGGQFKAIPTFSNPRMAGESVGDSFNVYGKSGSFTREGNVIVSGEVTAGSSIKLFVDGDVMVGGVYYGGYNINNVPRLTIYATGNIIVQNSVDEIHGNFIADRNFYSCGIGLNGYRAVSDAPCEKELTIYGTVVADEVVLGRTTGHYKDGTPRPAERIIHGPEVWLSAPRASDSGVFDSYTSLTPVL